MHQADASPTPAPDAQSAEQAAVQAAQAAQAAPAQGAAPAPAQGPGAATVQIPGAPTLSFPTSARELEGLKERRQILREQRDMATNRRSGLVEQLRSANVSDIGQQGRTALENRLKNVDEQILQIERDITTTEALMSGASPEVLAEARAIERQEQYRNSGYDDGEVAGMSAAFFGGGVLLTLLLGRIRRWRARRRGGPATAAGAIATTDPNIQRLNAAVDAIAEEVERIGEGQRFVTQLLSSRREVAALTHDDRG